jgi:hypothetical protein
MEAGITRQDDRWPPGPNPERWVVLWELGWEAGLFVCKFGGSAPRINSIGQQLRDRRFFGTPLSSRSPPLLHTFNALTLEDPTNLTHASRLLDLLRSSRYHCLLVQLSCGCWSLRLTNTSLEIHPLFLSPSLFPCPVPPTNDHQSIRDWPPEMTFVDHPLPVHPPPPCYACSSTTLRSSHNMATRTNQDLE